MIISFLSQQIRWKLALPGLMLVLAAIWLYPGTSFAHWSDRQWTRSLIGSTWTFSRQDGSVISTQLRLGTFGRIRGYAHPNEDRWTVRRGTLVFLGKMGHVTSQFALNAGAPLAGLRLPSDNRHALSLNEERHLQIGGMAALSAMLGLGLLAASVWLRSSLRSALVDIAIGGRRGPVRTATPLTRSARHYLRFITGARCACVLLAAWFLLVCTMASMPAYVPDEAWFYFEALHSGKEVIAHGEGVHHLLFHKNAFGYGSIWWSIYTCVMVVWDCIYGIYALPVADGMLAADPNVAKVMLIKYASSAVMAPMVIMRVIALAALGWFGLMLVRGARTGAGAVISVLALVSMPMMWWSGKLASPELLAAALFASAVLHWFQYRRALSSLLLATLAVGMKLTVMPAFIVLVGFVVWDIWLQPERRKCLVMYGLACTAVLLACNSWLFYDPKAGIEQLLFLSHAYAPNPDLQLQSDLVLWMHPDMWDATNYGSQAYWAGGFSLVVASLLAAFVLDRRLACFLVAQGIAQYLFMLTQPPHGWYWFPALLPLVIPFSRLSLRPAIYMSIFLMVSLYPFEYVRREWEYKTEHLQELEHVALQHSCIWQQLTAYQADVVYDMASLGTFTAETKDGQWQALNYHDSFVTLSQGEKAFPAGFRQVLLMGQRSARGFDFVRDRAQTAENVIGTCGTIKLVKIVRR
jgi:hypothetical protein